MLVGTYNNIAIPIGTINIELLPIGAHDWYIFCWIQHSDIL